MSKTQKTPKLTNDEIINLFCTAVSETGASESNQPKFSLFIGNRLFGRRFYGSATAAHQAVIKLAPRLAEGLKTKHPAKVASQVRNALRRNRALRKAAVAAAFQRELLYAGPPTRPALTPSPRTV